MKERRTCDLCPVCPQTSPYRRPKPLRRFLQSPPCCPLVAVFCTAPPRHLRRAINHRPSLPCSSRRFQHRRQSFPNRHPAHIATSPATQSPRRSLADAANPPPWRLYPVPVLPSTQPKAIAAISVAATRHSRASFSPSSPCPAPPALPLLSTGDPSSTTTISLTIWLF
ncbi:hypothetical protein M0R45_019451 [Rubus argutus]|uniref:Uncharacterized protein n=1 Tax=Rubus argutus TaxID=59490 RepID=A0AAW1X7X0_RUBAR